MQGSRNDSFIGMRNSRRDFDDSNWGYDRKNGRGGKGRGSKKQQLQHSRQHNNKRNYESYDY